MLQRIGELLVGYGELTPADLQAILNSQQKSYRPFGQIAAAMYNVRPDAIWRAWGSQYARYCPVVQLMDERCESSLAKIFTGMQAWEYHILPLRKVDGDIVVITDKQSLSQALRFVDESIRESAVIWLARSEHELIEMLERTYGPCPDALCNHSHDEGDVHQRGTPHDSHGDKDNPRGGRFSAA